MISGQIFEAYDVHEMFLLMQDGSARPGDLVIDGRMAENCDIRAYAIVYTGDHGGPRLLTATEGHGGFLIPYKIARELAPEGSRDSMKAALAHLPDWIFVSYQEEEGGEMVALVP